MITSNPPTSSNVSVFVGIDVLKDSLDVHILPESKALRMPNDSAGIESVRVLFPEPEQVLVVLEASGGYESELAGTLSVAGFHVAVVNPSQVRDFAKALGQAKARKAESVHVKVLSLFAIHAKVLALFAKHIRPVPSPLSDESLYELGAILTRRLQILEMITAETNRLDHARLSILQSDLVDHLEWLRKVLEHVNIELERVLHSSPIWREKEELVSPAPASVPTGSPPSAPRLAVRSPSFPALTATNFTPSSAPPSGGPISRFPPDSRAEKPAPRAELTRSKLSSHPESAEAKGKRSSRPEIIEGEWVSRVESEPPPSRRALECEVVQEGPISRRTRPMPPPVSDDEPLPLPLPPPPAVPNLVVQPSAPSEALVPLTPISPGSIPPGYSDRKLSLHGEALRILIPKSTNPPPPDPLPTRPAVRKGHTEGIVLAALVGMAVIVAITVLRGCGS